MTKLCICILLMGVFALTVESSMPMLAEQEAEMDGQNPIGRPANLPQRCFKCHPACVSKCLTRAFSFCCLSFIKKKRSLTARIAPMWDLNELLQPSETPEIIDFDFQ